VLSLYQHDLVDDPGGLCPLSPIDLLSVST
jgi:hypothetical protein